MRVSYGDSRRRRALLPAIVGRFVLGEGRRHDQRRGDRDVRRERHVVDVADALHRVDLRLMRMGRERIHEKEHAVEAALHNARSLGGARAAAGLPLPHELIERPPVAAPFGAQPL